MNHSTMAHKRKSVSRREALRTLALALAAPAIPLGVATRPAKAGKKKTKIITKTFSSNGQIDLAAVGTSGVANPYPTTIKVKAFKKYKKAKIKDVNLILRDITHSNPDDINIMLVHGNHRATVMSDVGGVPNISNVTLELDDQAGADLPNAALLTDGTYRPTNIGGGDVFPAPAPVPNTNVALSTFKGDKPDGKWQLYCYDDVNGNTGAINGGWKLEITAKVKNKKRKKRKKDD